MQIWYQKFEAESWIYRLNFLCHFKTTWKLTYVAVFMYYYCNYLLILYQNIDN
jgi:hypothetical protein